MAQASIDKANIRAVDEIFMSPPCTYRGAPFWAWNTKPVDGELCRQIDCFREMGFGGFFMHSRSGMATEYLGDDFMARVKTCVAQAERFGMKAYLYDEDRWPSGSAGGFVTREKAFRQKQVCLSQKDPTAFKAVYDRDERDPQLLTTYDVVFDENDRLLRYFTVAPDAAVTGEKWYAYILNQPCSGYHNGYTYADTMNPAAVAAFIHTTHEAYKREIGEKFGGVVPAIFTDEPNYGRFTFKAFARDGEDAFFPWSSVLRETFKSKYGSDIASYLPELVWDRANGTPSTVRYRYYIHIAELFSSSYCDRVGDWCAQNGIALTGHVLDEPTLLSQMCAVGDAMRTYRKFTVPGVDMLCNDREFTTVKQAQSAAHQFGRTGVASELYGVTGWTFDFRGHKFQGDWQAALGVTLRVPHLAWLSMEGSAKRDYPASIGVQSSWYKEYAYIENHFARLDTALTRGKPIVRVAVLHPIESAFLTACDREHSAATTDALDMQFQEITEWLLRGQIDFDFVSESLLPDQFRLTEEGFAVGEMLYDAVVVPPIVTVRKSTLYALAAFMRRGGKVFVLSACPKCVDGALSTDAQEVWETATSVPFTESDILSALEPIREISVLGGNGVRKKDILYTLRADGEDKWLFIAHCDCPTRLDGGDCACETLTTRVKGEYAVMRYDTLSGEIYPQAATYKNGLTDIVTDAYPLDSFLFRLSPKTSDALPERKPQPAAGEPLTVPDTAAYKLDEPNVAVLDMCEWSLDGKTFYPREEILRIDGALRKKFGFPLADGEDMQPWCLPQAEPNTFVYLRFTVESETVTPCSLGYERAAGVKLNGIDVPLAESGFYVDKAVHTAPLPALKVGKNELVIRAPISERVGLENYFLLGAFGVRVTGAKQTITRLPAMLTFGSVTGQGLPFYGGAITYRLPFACAGGDVRVTSDYYLGALIDVRLDGSTVGKIVLPPYTLEIPRVKAGEHTLEMTVYLSRQNTFGALHACTPIRWQGPKMWYTEKNMWSYEYCLTDGGIMKMPNVSLIKLS